MQINDIKRLAIRNRQIGTFKDIFSDPVSLPSSDLVVPEAPAPLSASTIQTINRMLAVRQNQKAKQKSIVNWQATNIRRQKAPATKKQKVADGSDNSITSRASRVSKASRASQRHRSPTPPSVQMELIRPGKRRVKVTADAVKSKASKRMRVA